MLGRDYRPGQLTVIAKQALSDVSKLDEEQDIEDFDRARKVLLAAALDHAQRRERPCQPLPFTSKSSISPPVFTAKSKSNLPRPNSVLSVTKNAATKSGSRTVSKPPFSVQIGPIIERTKSGLTPRGAFDGRTLDDPVLAMDQLAESDKRLLAAVREMRRKEEKQDLLRKRRLANVQSRYRTNAVKTISSRSSQHDSRSSPVIFPPPGDIDKDAEELAELEAELYRLRLSRDALVSMKVKRNIAA